MADGQAANWTLHRLHFPDFTAITDFIHPVSYIYNAAAAIMFPIAVATANHVGADPRGFVMAVAVASCCAFASPVTYQTHLIVYGPGGYRFTDFVKVGLPLDALCAVVAIAMIPSIWPFA